jgi:hypothetical protein
MLGELRAANRDANGDITAKAPYSTPKDMAWNGMYCARNGWTVVEKVDDFPPFNAVICVRGSVATAGADGKWEKVQGASYYLAELRGEALDD